MMRTQILTTMLGFSCFLIAGCASVTGNSPKLTQAPRTIVSADETPLALRDSPGRRAVPLDDDGPEPSSRPDGRISGRVVDENGRAVANAEVRLADGGSRSGRDQRVTTDASGAFSIRSLRPGGTYTLIAEDADGVRGRADDAAPGSRVTIHLGRDDETSAQTAQLAAPVARSTRLNRVSERSPSEEVREPEPADEPAPPKRTLRNLPKDDLPPAAEAEAVSEMTSAKIAWRKGATSDPAVAPVDTASTSRTNPEIPQPPAVEPVKPSPKPVVEDVPNPLPPAKERAEEPSPSPDPAPPPVAPPTPPSGDLPAVEKPPAESPPANNSAPAEPPANPFSPTASLDPGLRAEAAPRKLATWEDLADQGKVESLSDARDLAKLSVRRLPDSGQKSKNVAANESSNAKPNLLQRLTRGKAPEPDPVKATCKYDSGHRKIVEFLLPDVNGQPVRFADLDADFVLLDFWGTWCDPCLKSIPHLIELQEKYGSKTLQVVGVAAEKPLNFEEKSKVVRESMEKLGINYPVLISKADGSCPLQDALNIQMFPTMVLVDRTGEILWRDTGSTPITLSRLDKVIAARTETGIVRR